MSTAPKPFPLYTDGTSIFFTTDGVNFNSVGGGGSGTIHTSAPLSGDGSVGSPATIADGAITNASLATPPQSPAAVAITGGTIVGTAVNGQSAASAIAENAFLAAGLGWQQAQYATMIAAVPALTRFKWMDLGANSLAATAGAVANDGNVEGGGILAGTIQAFGVSTFQAPTAGNWAIAFRFKIPTNASTNVVQMGISSIAGPNTDAVWFGVRNASSATNFFARIVAGGTTTDTTLGAYDANWHDGVITDDGTTINYWFDGTLAGSTTTRTNLVTTPYQPFTYSSETGVVTSRMMIGYVEP